MTQPIDPKPGTGPTEKLRWQSSAKWTLVAVVGVTFGFFAAFYLLFLRA